MSAAATRPEDDAGLAGKVAIIAGGGARGRRHRQWPRGRDPPRPRGHRRCWWSTAKGAGRAHGGHDRGEGGAAAAHQADLTVARRPAAWWTAALDRFGRLDFLDNNVGIGSRGSRGGRDPENWRRVMQVNVETMFLAAKHAIPAMIKTAASGAPSSTSRRSRRCARAGSPSTPPPRARSSHSPAPWPSTTAARASASIASRPGPVYTPMVYQRGMSPAARDTRRKASALGIEGTGWDIGQAVRFLLSDHARYITGQTLVVDGGVTLQGPARDSEAH